MKQFLCLIFISFSTYIFSQELDINTKKGYAANGYDIVAYFNKTAKEGTKKFKTQHNGINYKFTSEENLKKFKSNPEKYLPQYGGYCAYAIGKRNTKMKIDPTTFKIIDGKLYLFYNFWMTNTSEAWDEEKDIKSKADKNWQTLKYKNN